MNQLKAASKPLAQFSTFYNEKMYSPCSYVGFTWFPEVVINRKITNFSSIIGAGVWGFGFLVSAQLFGLKGVITHSLVYGAGSLSHVMFLVIDNNRELRHLLLFFL